MNSSKVVIQYVGNSPIYIDGFKKDCKRSQKGSLHLLPNRLIEVESEELLFIKEKRPDVAKHLKEIPKPIERKAPELKEKEDEAPAEQEPVEVELEESEKELEDDDLFDRSAFVSE